MLTCYVRLSLGTWSPLFLFCRLRGGTTAMKEAKRCGQGEEEWTQSCTSCIDGRQPVQATGQTNCKGEGSGDGGEQQKKEEILFANSEDDSEEDSMYRPGTQMIVQINTAVHQLYLN
ncbi:hypothetical protein B0H14DRAFT_2649371 [Mycena olivaceomarginata]|nr:hypothetical protein B0H14DRAFT_2649371 [Mycena olivaceomarginata]